MPEMTEEEKKRKLAELDEQAKIALARKDPEYRKLHPELNLDLTAKADLDDPEQRRIVEKAIDYKKAKEKEITQSKDELEEENEDLKNKLAIIAEKEFEKKKAQLGCTDPEVLTPDALRMWEKGKKTVEGTSFHSPSGTARCDIPEQMGFPNNDNLPLRQKKFASYEAMITYTRELARKGDPESIQVLKELEAKALSDYGEHHQDISYSPDKNVPKSSAIPEVVMDNLEEKEPSELEKFGIKKKSKEKWGSVPKKQGE